MIRKTVVLPAGRGKRLMPLTLAMPKEMIKRARSRRENTFLLIGDDGFVTI